MKTSCLIVCQIWSAKETLLYYQLVKLVPCVSRKL